MAISLHILKPGRKIQNFTKGQVFHFLLAGILLIRKLQKENILIIINSKKKKQSSNPF